ncbi:TlpA family protein disulfide reductase [Nonomuraea sp. M3C6]|uniref:TlpA family protein disulfide reductase n=1 Tax=Nonomuraea marmarensis TaxID=3351344 RepID=A0ABW7ATE7_9ACTN
MEPITAAVIILFVLFALLLAAGAGLYRRVKELELAAYSGVGVKLAQESLSIGRPGVTTIVAKINRRCPVCEEVVAAIAKLAPDLPDSVSFTVVSDDPAFDKKLPESVQLIKDPEIWRSISVPFTPALLVVDEQGVIVYTTPAGSGDVVADIARRAIARKEVSL